MHACKLLTVYLVIILTGQTIVLGQNPLRAAPQQNGQFDQQQAIRHEYQPENRMQGSFAREPHVRQVDQNASSDEASHAVFDSEIPPVAFDQNVIPAGFNQLPQRPASPKNNRESASPAELLASISNGQWPDQNRLLDLIMKISMNLVFVLSFAFGLMLFAKRWLRPKTDTNQIERAAGDSLSIRETLRIDARTTIRLVQWRSNRFLIACDQNGIQSVHALNASFDQKLRELDDNSVDDKLISKLLSGARSKKT